MSTSNLDAFDLKDVSEQGLIREDVMNKIWDISKIPLVGTDMFGSSSHTNQFFEWTVDRLRDAEIDGQLIDGQDIDEDLSKTGRRMGNHSEIRGKEVRVSTRADAVNTIGFANTLAYQVTERQKELRRDVEATIWSNNPSVIGTSAVAGVSAGLAAWLVNDTDIEGNPTTGNVFRGAGGLDGGWDDVVTDSLVAVSTPGTPEAGTETKIRDVVQAVYTKGGNPSTACTTPAVKRLFSEYLFSSSARIASLIADGGGGASEREGSGSVDIFLTDFGTLKLIPNRLQPEYAANNDNMFILDSSLIAMSYLTGYRVEPLAKTGLSEKRFMHVDWSLCVKNWDGLGYVADIEPTTPFTFN